MSITGIEGKPGSGKTYYCMYHLTRKYFEFDKVLGEWFPRGSFVIVTNIEDIRLDHYSLDDMVNKAGGRDKFFTVEYQKSLLVRFPRIIYIIDECGAPDRFPKGLKSDAVQFLFQYHRHLGLDFYLLSPSMWGVSDQIVRLMESVLKASSRSKRIGRYFRYDRYIEGDRVGMTMVPIDKRIFKLYRSMNITEGEKVKRVYTTYLVGLAACAVLILGGMWLFQKNLLSGKRYGKTETVSSASSPSSGKTDISLKAKTALDKSEVVGTPSVAERGVGTGVTDAKSPSLLTPNSINVSPVLSIPVGLNAVGASPSDVSLTHVKIVVSPDVDGNSVVYAEDGQFFPAHQLKWLLSTAVRFGGALWVPRKNPTTNGERVEGGGIAVASAVKSVGGNAYERGRATAARVGQVFLPSSDPSRVNR